jgi:hypothetical protein
MQNELVYETTYPFNINFEYAREAKYKAKARRP